MSGDQPFDDKLPIPELEKKVMEFWEADRTFERSLEKTKDGQPFTFYDGPPFATGLPHYGHILASTIKDLVPRYQTMKGRYVRRRWGWDCHGLPIEEIVERKLGISGKKQIEEIGIQKFNETCRAMVLQFADEWGKMVRRMGRWIEFENSYKTMDRTFMESVWWAFKKIYDQGLVYEGRKVLMYCPRCETPVSNFEVAMDNSYKDVTEESATVKFKVKPGQKIGDWEVRDDTYLLAWTTTPWTLPGNVALAVGADIEYAKVQLSGTEEIYILALNRIADTLKGIVRQGQQLTGESFEGALEIGKLGTGKDLVGLAYKPLFDIPAVQNDKAFKVYAADFVTTEDGTGIVHTAVVYGEDDYQLGLKEGLPVVPLLDEKGKFNDKAPELIRGKYFKDSEKDIKDDLEKRGLLFKREKTTHSYPHCWRCGTMLYYNAIPAWFINVQKIKPELLKTNAEQISWFPEHLKFGRYAKSVESAPDWNISRNRYWGNPIPVWKCAKCGEGRVAGSIADLGLPPTMLYLVRHGESEKNTEGIVSSYPEKKEYPLTGKGRAEAETAADGITKDGLDLIFSSDLLRARETAEVIARATGAKIELDARLREIDTGVWNGRTEADFHAAHPDDAARWKTPIEGGESLEQVQARMLEVVNELTSKHPGKKIAIIGHGDPLFTLFRWFGLEGYPDCARAYKIETGLTDLHRPYIDEVVLQCACGGEMRRTPEIFDSWVEAGSMPFSEYHYPFENKELFESRFPAQFVAEYIAQTRAWFYVMHVMSQIVFGRAPFENVVTTGTILAEDGSKMSKSKNNFPDPWAVIDKYGVDSLRFYLMGSAVMQADNLNFSEKDLANVYRKTVMILWNVYQYFMTYSSVVPRSSSIEAAAPVHILDKWINARTKELVIAVTDHLDRYDTVRAARAIEEFVNDLSTWYLRRSRGREDAGFFPAFREVLLTVSRVIAPFMPHLAEAIYVNLSSVAEPVSVHLTEWPEKEAPTGEEQSLLKDMQVLREIASVGLALRKESNLPVRQPLQRIAFNAEFSSELADILKAELNVKEIVKGEISGSGIIPYGPPSPETEGLRVWLDGNLTPELKLEGLVRQLERFVQEMRKKQGFKVGEMAALAYETSDSEVEKALAALDAKKTYLSKVEKGTVSEGEDFEGRAKLRLQRQ